MDDDEVLSEEQLQEEGPLIEADLRVVGSPGKLFADDGSMRIAVIRPCVSRGRRLRGLPPIYTPSMLAEHASVFTDWPMYMGHLSEALIEKLAERERPLSDLGGRVVRSWYDPELTFPDDGDFGFQRGGVVAQAIPQPAVRAMLEADPGLLHNSINAWPTGARSGTAPWAPAVKGMVIEGIRRRPRGSVDFVYRGGAGGRPLAESDQLAISALEDFYDQRHVRKRSVPKMALTDNLSQLSDIAALREALREHNPDLLAMLPEAPAAPAAGETVKLEDVRALLQEQETRLVADFEAKLEDQEALIEERANELVREREQARVLEREAHQIIDAAPGLTPGFRRQLKERYAVLPSGPTQTLRVQERTEEDGKVTPPSEVLREGLEADITAALEMINESRGPAVRGNGGGTRTSQEGGGEPESSAFRDFMMESGGFEKPEDVDKIMEGAR